MAHHVRPTIGVLAGWQFYWTATPLSYLNPIFHGIRSAALDRGCNVLLACGMVGYQKRNPSSLFRADCRYQTSSPSCKSAGLTPHRSL
jgi:hypothetical protein